MNTVRERADVPSFGGETRSESGTSAQQLFTPE